MSKRAWFSILVGGLALAAVAPDAAGAPVLVGVYVGSVTQALSDCRKYLQYLNGYEAPFGHLAFYEEGIAAGVAALDAEP